MGLPEFKCFSSSSCSGAVNDWLKDPLIESVALGFLWLKIYLFARVVVTISLFNSLLQYLLLNDGEFSTQTLN